jgi:hypothetical protein
MVSKSLADFLLSLIISIISKAAISVFKILIYKLKKLSAAQLVFTLLAQLNAFKMMIAKNFVNNAKTAQLIMKMVLCSILAC